MHDFSAAAGEIGKLANRKADYYISVSDYTWSAADLGNTLHTFAFSVLNTEFEPIRTNTFAKPIQIYESKGQ